MRVSGIPLVLLPVLSTALLAAPPDFKREVQPILEQACVRCHGQEKDRGEFQLHTREAMMKGGEQGVAVVEGKPAESLLIKLVELTPDHEDIMPAKGDPLSRREIYTLKNWVQAGAPWPEGVVLTKKERVSAEDAAGKYAVLEQLGLNTSTASAQIDKLIDYDNRGRGELAKAPMLDDLAFLRKVTIDLTGRIPTVEDVMEFRRWPDAERRAKAVEKLLAADRFNERWTVFFADMLRIRSNADGGNALLAYVNKCLREGKPYDELARELIATNGRPSDHPAAAFALAEDADPLEMAAVTAQTFLGVRLGCAMCHNHPFDEWDQRQFYEMASFFGKTKRVQNDFGMRMVYTTEGQENQVLWPPERQKPPSREPVPPKFPFVLEDAADAGAPPHIARLRSKRDNGSDRKKARDGGGQDRRPPRHRRGPGEEGHHRGRRCARRPRQGQGIHRHRGRPLPAERTAPRVGRQDHRPTQPLLQPAPSSTRVWGRADGPRVLRAGGQLHRHHPGQPREDPGAPSRTNSWPAATTCARSSGSSFRPRPTSAASSAATSTARPARRRSSPTPPPSRAACWPKCSTTAWSRPGTSSTTSGPPAPTCARSRSRSASSSIPNRPIPPPRPRRPPPPSPTRRPAADPAPAPPGGPAMAMAAMAAKPAMSDQGYNLESGLEIDFDQALMKKDVPSDLAMMKAQSDEQLRREQARKAREEAQRRRFQRYTYKTVTETIDDNPRYGSSMRHAVARARRALPARPSGRPRATCSASSATPGPACVRR